MSEEKLKVTMTCAKCGSKMWQSNDINDVFKKSLNCETCIAILNFHSFYLTILVLNTMWILFKCF